VTDTQEQTAAAPSGATAAANGSARSRAGKNGSLAGKNGSLASMLLPELKQVAGGLGLSTSKMKKSDLVAAIEAARGSGKAAPAGGAQDAAAPARSARAPRTARSNGSRSRSSASADAATTAGLADAETTSGAAHSVDSVNPVAAQTATEPASESRANPNRQRGDSNRASQNRQQADQNRDQNRNDQNRDQNRNDQNRDQNRNDQNRGQNQGGQSSQSTQGGQGNQYQGDDDFDGGRRRGRRYRDRRGRTRDRVPGTGGGMAGMGNDVEPTVSDDDILVPVAGILDAIEEKNTWFVRTAGYFASSDDVYVANSYVRRFGLRRGDTVTGAIKQARDGERREKYNPLVRLDTVNGADPEQSRNRVEFTKLTPLYPQERLRLETEPHIFTTRVIDLVMPIGKGQRALIVSPPKAGKTMVLQSIANAIATNNPEVHLMVVLIDERPEEVTDMQRSVKGEVIASTFDRKPVDHTTVAELSIERAKRLVEMGHDVVVLLDSITRLGRAYNLAAPASGRILSGGVDSTALYPPKRFLGAARNIENGGSLTILATALVETGSAGDTVIFEEFKGTGNAELKLDRKIADKRVFPAVDVDQSSTRKEELLLSPDELAVTIKLRRVLHSLEQQQAIDLLLDRLKKTRTNLEFLMQIAKTTPGQE
jgi:transcription termination factor Rho